MKSLKLIMTALWLVIMSSYYWIVLPPINFLAGDFWTFLLIGIVLALAGQWLSGIKVQTIKRMTRGQVREDLQILNPKVTKLQKMLLAFVSLVIIVLASLSLFNSRVFRAKSYANAIQVQEVDFVEDFPESNISTLALLDRASAKKIGDTYLGTIDKVSQFGISDEYRQITIGEQPYRVSPLEYKNFWKWLSNHREGITYYVKVNQTTGKAELVKLDQGMKYSYSEYFFHDTLRYLRLKHPTDIFGKPSFEIADDGTPYYVATTYKPLFGLSSQEPVGAILLNAVTGETKQYALKDIPTWVDRIYSANNVITRVNDHYTYQKGFWNTMLSQTGVKNTTDSYNYITIGSDIYLYTGITSATADSSNLGFILVNMRTRQVTNYQLASATETAAQESAEGEVQEKKYEATAPTLVKLSGKAYYLVSLKDDAGLVKSYALVDAEDYQQVTVNNDIEILISQFTDSDTSGLSGLSGANKKEIKTISGKVEELASQMISGSTVYYISSNGQIYKIKASKDSPDKLPFIKVGDHFTGQLGQDNYLNKVEISQD